MNHPAGRIGKRLILKVHDVMLTGSSLPLIGPNVLIMEVRASLAQLRLAIFELLLLHASMLCSLKAGHASLHEPGCDSV